jgi:alkylation response protein AidB-like acyl-CoA dehydrogenase
MNLELSKDQKLIKSSAREFLVKECPKEVVREIRDSDSGHSEELWQKIAELGWMGLVIPEEYGGTAVMPSEFLSLAILLEEIGYNLWPSPFFSTVVLGALPILEAGNDSQKERFLPEISEGRMKLGLALLEPSGTYKSSGIEAKAVTVSGGYQITGTKLFVEYGHIADFLICAVRTKKEKNPEQGVTLFIVDPKSPGVSVELIPTIGIERQCVVHFEDVFISKEDILGALDRGWPIIENILEKAAVAKSAQMLGGMQVCLEMTNNYVKKREQYGKTISSFQIIQHYLADVWMDIVGSRELVYEAASMVEKGLPCRKMASMTKAWVGKAFYRVSGRCCEMHGAIGMTEEYDAGLYYRQAKLWDLAFGSAESHLSGIGDAFIGDVSTKDYMRH